MPFFEYVKTYSHYEHFFKYEEIKHKIKTKLKEENKNTK
jgi:hypothetical protein